MELSNLAEKRRNTMRIIEWIMILVIIFSLSGCQNAADSTNATTATSKDITLNTVNAKGYLNIEVSYTFLDGGYSELFHSYSGTAEAEIKIYPIRSAKYSNAKLTLEISCPLFWEVSSKDSAYKKDDEKTMYVEITLPANGTYTKKVKLTTLAYSKPDLPDTAKSNDIKIASASGKVQDS